jgi:hypothetical protein
MKFPSRRFDAKHHPDCWITLLLLKSGMEQGVRSYDRLDEVLGERQE